MNLVKLGRKGQVSIPRAILQELRLDGEQMRIVETSPDGAIVLRPATVAPIELYDEARVTEFLAEDALTPELETRLERTRRVGRST